jgi:adenylate cyclase
VVVRPEGPNRRLAAILSADVVGYSRLMAEDDAGTVRTLAAYRDEMALLVEQHRGRVVDFTGDNLLAEFPSALDAAHCAVELQRVIAARNADLAPERRMQFRMGVHLGDVMVEGERIYGDGVNIAARLEGLAEAGGICISGVVQEQVRGRLQLGYEDLGEQKVKNIPEPVRVLRVQAAPASVPVTASRLGPRSVAAVAILLITTVAGIVLLRLQASRPPSTEATTAAVAPEATPGNQALTVPGFGDAPAIAVLPFDNLSGDPNQEYFADGVAEDLITRLSSRGGFPVIARNSSFTYKGQAVDVKQVGRELGARYVVEGSVRKAGGRISAQLIDAASGHHVWAQTYDRELRDIFALQDEITEAIVGSIRPALFRAEVARAARKEPRNLDAYDLEMRGFWHSRKVTREENVKARSLFEQAIELDPESSTAFAGLAMTHSNDVGFQWSDRPAESVSASMRAAQRSVALDANNSMAQFALCLAYFRTRQPEEMIAAAERAVDLDPSNAIALAWLGMFLAGQGRLEEGLSHAEKAIRLSPRDPILWFYLSVSAWVHFQANRYEDAVEWAKRSIRANPRFFFSRAVLAASYGHLGRGDEARAAVEELLRVQPGYSLTFVREGSVDAPAYRDHYLDGLRKAGLPEE